MYTLTHLLFSIVLENILNAFYEISASNCFATRPLIENVHLDLVRLDLIIDHIYIEFCLSQLYLCINRMSLKTMPSSSIQLLLMLKFSAFCNSIDQRFSIQSCVFVNKRKLV